MTPKKITDYLLIYPNVDTYNISPFSSVYYCCLYSLLWSYWGWVVELGSLVLQWSRQRPYQLQWQKHLSTLSLSVHHLPMLNRIPMANSLHDNSKASIATSDHLIDSVRPQYDCHFLWCYLYPDILRKWKISSFQKLDHFVQLALPLKVPLFSYIKSHQFIVNIEASECHSYRIDQWACDIFFPSQYLHSWLLTYWNVHIFSFLMKYTD